jgi:hypothetical protein
MKNRSLAFIAIPLPHGYTTKAVLTKSEKLEEHKKLLSGPLPWANQDFLGLYDAAGALSAIIIANHCERKVFSVTSAGYRPLGREAQEAVSAYLSALDYSLSGVFNRALDDCVLGADGKFYGTSELPDELHVRGDMNFQLNKEVVRLPRRKLIVDGDLDLRRSQVETFPTEFLHVKGDLHLSESNVVKIPSRTRIGGSFDPSGEMEELPSMLQVGDILTIGYTRIKSVPFGTRCRRLFIWEHQLEGLPLWLNPMTEVVVWPEGPGGTVSVKFAALMARRLMGRSLLQIVKGR